MNDKFHTYYASGVHPNILNVCAIIIFLEFQQRRSVSLCNNLNFRPMVHFKFFQKHVDEKCDVVSIFLSKGFVCIY